MIKTRIKVGFIVDDIDRPAMGTALYMQKLIEQYVTTFKDEVELVLIYREGNCRLLIPEIARRLPIKKYNIPKFSGFFSFLRFFLTSREVFDIIHFPRPKLFPFFWKLKAKGFVVTFHDAPEENSTRFRTWHNYFFEWFIRLWGKYYIDVAIGDTKFAAKNISRYFHIKESKTFGVVLAGGSNFKPLKPKEVKNKKHLLLEKYNIQQPYILQVARLAPHKNVHRVIKAFDILKKEKEKFPHQLVILGGREHAPEYDKLVDKVIRESPYVQDIYIAPYIENEDMAAVYNLADIFVQASLSEGFSIPIVDAFKAGVAVVCSNVSVFPEIVGDAAIQVNPFDQLSIAGGMKKLLTSSALRQEKIAKGFKKGREYSWERAAGDTIAIYLKVLNDKNYDELG